MRKSKSAPVDDSPPAPAVAATADAPLVGELFGLSEPLLADFSCALLDKIRYHGRMYLFANHIAFASTVFGDTKIVLPMHEVRSIARKKSVLVVPDAIEIVCGEPWFARDQCETFVFAAFFNRELVFATLERAWQAAQAAATAATATAAAAAASAKPNDVAPVAPVTAAASSSAPPPEHARVHIAVPPSPPPTPANVPSPQSLSPVNTPAESAAPAVEEPPPQLPASAAAVAATPLSVSGLRNTGKIVRRAPMAVPALPSLMPAAETDAIPFVSASCPHVANSAVDETFTSESATASTTIQQELPNCTLAAVWHTLFKTTAFWRRVHARVDYFDFEGSPWRARFANAAAADEQQTPCCVERLITFKVALNQPVGPKQTRMTQTLVARFVTPRRLVIETVSQCHDAPYADSFLVHSMLVVDEKHDGNCLLRVWWGVRFLRTVWMVKGLIESQALRDNQQFYGVMALEALEELHARHDRKDADAAAPSADAGSESPGAPSVLPRSASSPSFSALTNASSSSTATAIHAAPPPSTAVDADVGAQIQHIVVGDNPPMLARSVVYSLLGVLVLWLISWLAGSATPAASSTSSAPVDDPVLRLQNQVERLTTRVDALSVALMHALQLPRDALPSESAVILEALKASELSAAARAMFDARVLLQRIKADSGSDDGAVATLQAALNLLQPRAEAAPVEPWAIGTVAVLTTIAVGGAIAALLLRRPR